MIATTVKSSRNHAPSTSTKAIAVILLCVTVVSPMFSAEPYTLLMIGSACMLSFFGTTAQNQTITWREVCGILSSCLILIPYFLSGSLPYITDGITLTLCFCILWGIAHYRVKELRFSVALMILLTAWCGVESAYQRTVGHSFLSGHLPMFGWKITGPYPFGYLDTYALVFIPTIWYAMRRHGIYLFSGSVAIVLWIVMLVLVGNRSTILIAASTVLFSAIIANRKPHSIYPRSDHKLHIKNIKYRKILISLLIIGSLNFYSELLQLVPEQLIARTYDLYDWTTRGDFSESNRTALWSAFVDFSKHYPEQLIFGYGFGTLLFQNDVLFQDSRLNIDDLQSVWLDLIYSVGIFGTITLLVTLFAFYKKYRVASNSGAKATQIFLCAWFLSPFNLSHKLMDVWFCLNITLGLALVIVIFNDDQKNSQYR